MSSVVSETKLGMKKTFAEKWYWFVSHIWIPILLLLSIWFCIDFIISFPINSKVRNYIELFDLNILFIISYVLFIFFGGICLYKLLAKRSSWKGFLFVYLLAFPFISDITSIYTRHVLKVFYPDLYYSSNLYNISFSSQALYYFGLFCVFSLPTILILGKFSFKTDSQETAFVAANDIQDVTPLEVVLVDAEKTANQEKTAPEEKVAEEETAPIIPIPSQSVPEETNEVKKKFCSQCGNMIDPTTKKCTGCGKQYFRGIPWKKVTLVAMTILLVVSCVWNIWLYTKVSDLEQKNFELVTELAEAEKMETNHISGEKTGYRKTVSTLVKILNFFDENIALIEDDGTNLYHKYRCKEFLGENFLAYNEAAARDKGYEPCPQCVNLN